MEVLGLNAYIYILSCGQRLSCMEKEIWRGFVTKRGSSVKVAARGVMLTCAQNWKYRWMTLTKDGMLRYYKVKGSWGCSWPG